MLSRGCGLAVLAAAGVGLGGLGFGLLGAGCSAWLLGGGVLCVVVGAGSSARFVSDVVGRRVVSTCSSRSTAFFFFLAGALRSALSAGSVPPTSTPATAAGAATLMLSAFTPAPAVSVFDPPDLASAERGRERGDDGHEADGD